MEDNVSEAFNIVLISREKERREKKRRPKSKRRIERQIFINSR